MARKQPPRDPNRPEWQDSRVRTVPLPQPDPATSLFAAADWNTTSFGITGLPKHLSLEVLRVPEGLAVIARCAACGGRREGMLDGRALFPAGADPTETDHERLLATLGGQIQEVLVPLLEEWRPQHERCDREPQIHVAPPIVQAFVAAVLRDAGWDLAAGRQAGGMIHLLLGNGEGMGISMRGIPDRSPEDHGEARRVGIALLHYGVREFVRRRQLDVVGGVLISEAWISEADAQALAEDRYVMPSRDPKRREAIVVSVSTPSMGQMGYAEIRRKGGRLGKGPGAFGALDWRPLSGDAPLIDGLLAVNHLRKAGPGDAQTPFPNPANRRYQ